MKMQPIEVEINGSLYRIGSIDAFTQMKIAKRLAPGIAHLSVAVNAVLGLINPKLKKPPAAIPDDPSADPLPDDKEDDTLEKVVPVLAESFSKLSDDDIDYVVKTCLRVCHKKDTTGGWAPVTDGRGNLMFDNMNALDLIRLSSEVIKDNLGSFFHGAAPLTGAAAKGPQTADL